MEDFMLPCTTKKYLGFECLGCGTQRAIALLLKGEFTEAFYMYPAIYTMIPFFCFLLLNFIDKGRNYQKIIIGLAIINAIIMVVSYIHKIINH